MAHPTPTRHNGRKPEPHRRRETPPRLPNRDYAELCRELGLGVTLCMAATTINGPIVAVSDRRITWDQSGSPADDDAVFKAAKIGKQWGLLFAGDDVCKLSPLRMEIANRLLPLKPDEAPSTVRKAVEDAYRSCFAKQFFAEHLSRYGFQSFEDFKANGLNVFGAENLATVNDQIAKYDFGIELLVFGFTPGPPFGHQHVFEVRNPGVVTDREVFGYGIIGSGLLQALTILLSKPFRNPTVTDAVWRLCEAKFSAETSFAVGKETNVLIAKEDGNLAVLTSNAIAPIRAAWERDRRAGPSPDMADAIWRAIATSFPGAEKGSI